MKNRILAIIVVQLIAGCSPVILGHYHGKVINSQTGEPIQGAIIRCEWDVASPTVAGSVSSRFDEFRTMTDVDGKFFIPIRIEFPIPISFFSMTDLFIDIDGFETVNYRFMEDLGSTYKYKRNMLIRLNKQHLYGIDFDSILRELNYNYIRADRADYYRPEKILPNDSRTISAPPALIQDISKTTSAEDLINFSKNSNAYLRQAALRQLVKLYKIPNLAKDDNTEQLTLAWLTASLRDADDYVVETAIWAIGQLDNADGIKALAPLLLDDRYRISTISFHVAKQSKWNSSREYLADTLMNASSKHEYADERGAVYKLRAAELRSH